MALKTLGKEPFENIVGKDENAGNQHFLHFPQCFQHFSYIYFYHMQMLSIWSSPNLCRMVKSLTAVFTRHGFYVVQWLMCDSVLKYMTRNLKVLGPHSPTILSLVLQIFLYMHLAALECNTTSNWLINAV